MTNNEYEKAKKNVTFNCRFHPTDWFMSEKDAINGWNKFIENIKKRILGKN
jgi:peptide methionine sulfoxide reductase MsrB